jgi:hypothetical protein
VDESEKIVRIVQERLEGSAHTVLRTVSFRYERGALFLWGRLPSYFHKQLAQEAVRWVDGVAQIVNEIEVSDQPDRHVPDECSRSAASDLLQTTSTKR